jgi:hypothetical protein
MRGKTSLQFNIVSRNRKQRLPPNEAHDGTYLSAGSSRSFHFKIYGCANTHDKTHGKRGRLHLLERFGGIPEGKSRVWKETKGYSLYA